MERPDLDAIRKRLHGAKRLYTGMPVAASTFDQQVSDTAELLTYCRALEAENKRLDQKLAKFDRPYTGELRS